ncbi:hypothetical protein [Thetidibacter halocola]|uniref:Uncharacterized protein n=1 Tax=Thetidibacter halocola TaxID=2827239 RepID=A0A8J8B9T9_9RHOB|nr:hypothetical protein [Thetidibacter halocola]MBS0126872.1 hypothetical protein [Thetidibacter halocola]
MDAIVEISGDRHDKVTLNGVSPDGAGARAFRCKDFLDGNHLMLNPEALPARWNPADEGDPNDPSTNPAASPERPGVGCP